MALKVLANSRRMARARLLFESCKDSPLGIVAFGRLIRDLGFEAVLSHVVKGQTERAYLRTDLLDPRREVMEDWGNYTGETGRA